MSTVTQSNPPGSPDLFATLVAHLGPVTLDWVEPAHSPTAPSMLEAALDHARTFPVFPLHEVKHGCCACSDDACKDIGKHPSIKWRDGATQDADRVRRWWELRPERGIGLATSSELFVLDVDVANGKPGAASLKNLTDRFGDLPLTLTVRTGSGGQHYYFCGDGRPITNSPGSLPRGLDIRGEGGYVVAPPSSHKCGTRYSVEARAPIAPAPVWLLDLVTAPRATAQSGAIHDADFELTREHCAEQARALSRKTTVEAQRLRKLWQDLADGVPLCARGEGRAHTVLLNATRALAETFPTATPESVVELLASTWDPSDATEVENAFNGAVEKFAARQAEHATQLATYEAAGLAFGDGGKPLNTPANVLKVVRTHGRGLGGSVRLNVRGQLLECRVLPWDARVTWREWTDTDDMRAAEWLQDRWQLYVAPATVRPAVAAAASENELDPFQEWLVSLSAWDGKPRLETWLTRTFGGVDTRYTRAVASKFVLSILARTAEPGARVQSKLVLVGAQGLGKSTTLEVLIGSKFFVSSAGDASEQDKDRLARFHRAVLVEDQEMDAFSREAVSHDKAFLTTDVDVFRPPYGRSTGSFPRRFVMVGTTNELHGFLRDITGGRRYWPFACERPADLEWLRANREQLWAEAVALWAEPARRVWWLSPDEEIAARVEQERYRDRDQLEERLAALLDLPCHPASPQPGQPALDFAFAAGGDMRLESAQIHEGRIHAITAFEAWRLLNRDREDGAASTRELRRVSNLLTALGWNIGSRVRRDGRRDRLFVRPSGGRA